MSEVEHAYWNIPVPKKLDDAVKECLRYYHISKAEFIREAVRHYLEEKGLLLLAEKKKVKKK